ncbi:MAG: hypothetical protein ACI38Q_06010 [Candidatus Bruticola sp.]
MVKKNTFCFTAFAAAASLGLGLLVSGCGDSGSTTPNDLNAKYGTVTFNYNVLAAAAAKATDVQSEIVTVKYAFYGLRDGGARFVDGPDDYPSYTYNFTHGEEDTEKTVTVNRVSVGASRVVATYYDSEGKLVAAGTNEINFGANNNAEVSEPEISELEEFDLVASKHVVALDGETNLVLFASRKDASDEEDGINLTAFAKIEGIDAEILKPYYESETGVTYIGVKHGTIDNSNVFAEIGGVKYALDEPIYVTSQSVESLKVIPEKDSPCGIYSEDTLKMLYAPDKDSEGKVTNGSFGMGYVDLYEVGKEDKSVAFVAAVNTAPLQVEATYTNTEGMGPQPQNIDLLQENDSNLKIDIIPSNEEANLMEIDDFGFLVLNGINNTLGNMEDYIVRATYGDAEDAPSDDLAVEAIDGKPALAFCSSSFSDFLPEIKHVQGTEGSIELYIAGRLSFGQYFESYPIFIANDILAADAYPAVVEPSPSPEGLSYTQKEENKNGYVLTIDSTVGTGNVLLDVEDVDNMPDFKQSRVVIE